MITGNDIAWKSLTKDTSSVSFVFNKTITIGNGNSDFSGTVIQPLNYAEPFYRLSFDLKVVAELLQRIK
ncbi:hypothetical protein AZF37_06190 [endosymbiont 'TC1' of Trimyema compressum]|uniref:Ig-like domain-containing protein n=1 Tax=endosymbiont 'TC1' of Trimyema compressum TaxID=243899 RepID=UPI0007F11E7E|nr:Ig-like domain-containing protein [endosymbiont 'TC1' of Trimyema compressum]AMP20815.1 hypothetical protein AZF37_06190 [endosymbiont 'TC1' of Trimyema compressum]